MNVKFIKLKFYNWTKNTTFHGIPHIFIIQKSLVKLIWIMCILISSSYGLYLVFQNLIAYLNHEVRTIFKIDSESVTKFPTLSLCNLETCSSQKIDKCVNSRNETISNYLKECKFDMKNCSDKDFFEFYFDNYRKCFQFNGRHTKLITESKAGKSNGLKIRLEFNTTNCCELDNIVLYVHKSSDWISYELTGYLINYGIETDVAIERTSYTKKSKPFSDCVMRPNEKTDSISVSKAFGYLGGIYNQQICKYFCFQEHLQNTMSCHDLDLPKTKSKNYSACNDIVGFDKLKNRIYPKIHDQCLRECPIECNYQTYQATLSMIKHPENYSKKIILNVFYKSDSYINVNEDESITFSNLLSNIGSSIGLFMGISFLSVAEIINLIFEILIALIENRIKTEPNKNKETEFN